MTGTIKEMYLSELHSHRRSDNQVGLGSFTTENDETDEIGTAISVVTEPTGGISEACDESIPKLGMPLEKLNQLRKKRAEIQENRGVNDVQAHNQAIADLGLEEKYKEHITQPPASSRVDELVSRIVNGETITVVCFEKSPKWCHRHVLKEEIEKRLNSQD